MSSEELSNIIQYSDTETAWGRSRFTEAEIKKAFELRDTELRKAEAEAAALSSSEKSSKSSSRKSESKRSEELKRKKEEARRKEEMKQKKSKSQDSKAEKLEPALKTNGDMDDDESSSVVDQQNIEAWNTMMTYNLASDPIDWSTFGIERSQCDSFEDILLLAPDGPPPPKLQSHPIHESLLYKQAVEDSLYFVQGRHFTFSMLGPENILRILEFMDTSTVISAIRTCSLLREYGKSRDFWRVRFFRLERSMFGHIPDVNIWAELGTNLATLVRDSEGQVKEASLNKLVAAVTPQAELPDMMDVSTFMVTYQTFTTTSNLIRKLMQRYIVPEKEGANPDEIKNYMTNVVRPIQMRVCKLLKQLLETQHGEIDALLLSLIKVFVMGIIDQTVLAKLIQSGVQHVIMKNKKANVSYDQSSETASSSNAVASSSNSMGTLKRPVLMTSFYELSSEDIAKTLTIIEFEVYSQLKPTEFFGQAWSKPKYHHRAPNIRAMIDRFNTITRWITSEIVSEEKLRNRVKRVMKFIKVAQALRQLHNYHTLMAILGGLNEGPVYRLKYTKSEIPPKFQQAYSELQTIMSADGSYNAYRLELAAATPPCIPYIGVYLRDLTYFDEGAAGPEGMINFKSKKNVYSVIQIIQKYQGVQYPFKANERAYYHLKSISGLDDATLHKTSLLREPKNAKRADIQ